nr:MAG TPA: hypothetical protein [Caudoviricetes sp.]
MLPAKASGTINSVSYSSPSHQLTSAPIASKSPHWLRSTTVLRSLASHSRSQFCFSWSSKSLFGRIPSAISTAIPAVISFLLSTKNTRHSMCLPYRVSIRFNLPVTCQQAAAQCRRAVLQPLQCRYVLRFCNRRRDFLICCVVHLLAVAQHLGHRRRHLHVHTALDQIRLAVHAHKACAGIPAVVLEQMDDLRLGLFRLHRLGAHVLHRLFRLHRCLLLCHLHSPFSVRLCLCAVPLRAALNAHHVLLAQALCGLYGLPAHGRALVQRVVAVAQLLYDVLQAAALQLSGGVGVCAQHQRAEHRKALRAAGALPDLCLAGLHKPHIVDLADLALKDLIGACVLVGLHPVGVALDVVDDIRMDDAHIAAARVAHRVGVLHLQLRHRLIDQIHGQLCSLVQTCTAGHRRLRAARTDLGCIDHVGAAAQDIPHNGVHSSAGLARQHTGGLHHVVVDGGQLHHVGQGHPAAVLVHLSGHRAHGQCLAFRGHALGQRGGRFRQRLILAELNGLAIVRRDGVAVAKLVMHQRRQRLIDQALLIKGFHLRGHTAGAGGVLQLLVGIRKLLQVHLLPLHSCVLLQRFISLTPSRGKSQYNFLSPPCPAFQLLPLSAGGVADVKLRGRRAAGAGAVLAGSRRPLLDPRRHALLHGLGGACGGLLHNVVKVGRPVCVRQAHAPPHQLAHLFVRQHLTQIKVRVLGFQLRRLGIPLRPDLCRPPLPRRLLLCCLELCVLVVGSAQITFHLVQLPRRFHAHAPLLRQLLVVGLVLHLAVLHGLDQSVHVLAVHAVGLAQCLPQGSRLGVGVHRLTRLDDGLLHHLVKDVAVLAPHQLPKGSALFLRGLFHLLLLRLLFLSIRRPLRGSCQRLSLRLTAQLRGLFLRACLSPQRTAAPRQPLLCRTQRRLLHRRGCLCTALSGSATVAATLSEILQVHLPVHHVRQLRRVRCLAVCKHHVHHQLHVLRVALCQRVQSVLYQLHPCFHHVAALMGRGHLHLHPALAVRHSAQRHSARPRGLFYLVGKGLHQAAHRCAHNVLPVFSRARMALRLHLVAGLAVVPYRAHHTCFDHIIFSFPLSKAPPFGGAPLQRR